MVIVGTKADLDSSRVIPSDGLDDLRTKHGVPVLECSVLIYSCLCLVVWLQRCVISLSGFFFVGVDRYDL
jgi:hypothetical protein